MRNLQECLDFIGATLEPLEGRSAKQFVIGDKKFKAIWSSEAAADLKAFHGIDAEREILLAVLTEIFFESIVRGLHPASKNLEFTYVHDVVYTAAHHLAMMVVDPEYLPPNNLYKGRK